MINHCQHAKLSLDRVLRIDDENPQGENEPHSGPEVPSQGRHQQIDAMMPLRKFLVRRKGYEVGDDLFDRRSAPTAFALFILLVTVVAFHISKEARAEGFTSR